MNQKIIQVGNRKLLVLDMPEGATFSDASVLMMNNLTDIEYKIVGFKTDLTESQWAEIVGIKGRFIVTYPNFNHTYASDANKAFCGTATESGLSLLQANDCDWNNALIIEIL